MRSSLFAALALVAACNGETTRTEDILALTGDVSAGETVYTDNCAVCHLADGTGETNGGLGQDLTQDLPGEHAEAVDVILGGKEDMPAFDGSEPPYPALGDQDIADVVAYMYATF